MANKKTNQTKTTKKNSIVKEPEVIYVNKRKPAWRNLWFWMFTILLTSLLFAGAYLFGLVNRPNQSTNQILDQQLQAQKNDEKLPATFDLTLNKKQVNSMIANYIQTEDLKDITAQINDKNKFVIAGTGTALGAEVNYLINFDVSASDGKIILTATDAKIGSADVPTQVALSLIQNNIKLAKNIQVNSLDSQIVIDANNIRLDSNQSINFKVSDVDLANDKINLVGSLN